MTDTVMVDINHYDIRIYFPAADAEAADQLIDNEVI